MARVASPAFVGRAAELAALDDAMDRAARGQTTTVLIGGDAGIGKTRLLETWNGSAAQRGARIAVGSCLDLGQAGPPYMAVIEALRDLLRQLGSEEEEDLLGSDRTVLARIVPQLARDPGDGAPDLSSIGFAQTRLFNRLMEVLLRASSSAPVILELEDIHWADQSSQAFLLYMVEVARDARLLVVCTYRPEAADSDPFFRTTLGQLLRRHGVATLHVAPFDQAEIQEQLTGVLGRPPSTALLEAIRERSEGNPLFAEELAASRNPGVDLPASVAAATATKVEALSTEGQSVVRAASVVGRTTSYDVLRRVSELDDRNLEAALREAVRSRILEPVHVGEAYRFRHALLQEAIYEDTLPGERRRLHASVAVALAPDDDMPLDADLAPRLARHWDEAGDVRRAFGASATAAGLAERQSAYAEAARHYERMLELWEQVDHADDEPTRADLCERAAWASFLTGDYERSVGHGRAALAELEKRPDPEQRVRVLSDLSWSLSRLGDDAPEITDALADLDIDIDTDGLSAVSLVIIKNARVVRLDAQAQHAAALQLAGPLVEEAAATGNFRVYAQAATNLADLLRPDDPNAALSVIAPVREAAAHVDDDAYRLDLELTRCRILTDALMTEDLLRAAAGILEFAGQSGLGRWARPILRTDLAESHLRLGNLRACLEQVELALSDEPAGRFLALLQLIAGLASIAMGELSEAAQRLEASRLPNTPIDEELNRGWLATARAQLALADGRYEDVQRIVAMTGPRLGAPRTEQAMGETAWWLAEVGLAGAAEEAEIGRARNDSAALQGIRERVPELTGYVEQVRRQMEMSGRREYPTTPGFDALIAGHVARIEDRDEPGLWHTAASFFPPRSVESLAAHYREAEAMLSARVPRHEVQALMASAHQVAVEIGARPLATRFEGLARRARIELSKAPGAAASQADHEAASIGPAEAPAGYTALRTRGLSDREIEVLTLVATGFSNHQIAERLFISDKTASVHVSHILDKLGVGTRVEAATIGVRLGLPEVV